MKEKFLAFEYLVFKLVEWYKIYHNINNNIEFNELNDFSKLKILKLHFFISTVNCKESNLFQVFNNFYALPYGHIEKDIYDNKSDYFNFDISARKTLIKDNINFNFDFLDNKIISDIDISIEKLKIENNDIINFQALDLVDISHQYFSWKFYFNKAISEKIYSKFIPTNVMEDELKYYLNYEI